MRSGSRPNRSSRPLLSSTAAFTEPSNGVPIVRMVRTASMGPGCRLRARQSSPPIECAARTTPDGDRGGGSAVAVSPEQLPGAARLRVAAPREGEPGPLRPCPGATAAGNPGRSDAGARHRARPIMPLSGCAQPSTSVRAPGCGGTDYSVAVVVDIVVGSCSAEGPCQHRSRQHKGGRPQAAGLGVGPPVAP